MKGGMRSPRSAGITHLLVSASHAGPIAARRRGRASDASSGKARPDVKGRGVGRPGVAPQAVMPPRAR